MKRLIQWAMVSFTIIACVMLATTATSEDGTRDRQLGAKVLDIATPSDGGGRAILQYDDGVPVYREGGIGPDPTLLFIGNFFSPGLPPTPPPNYSITAASVNLAGFFGTRFHMGFFRSPSHSTAPLEFLGLRSIAATATGWQSVLFATPITSDGPFLVGVVQSNWTTCTTVTGIGVSCEGVALGPGTNNGYGHNAMRVKLPNVTGTVGSSYSTIPGQNALIRLNGYVPVELMRLEVD